jgi:uncharacterized protein YndB with AHSA1/START domain
MSAEPTPNKTAGPATTDAAYGVIVGPGVVRFERTLPGPIERVWSYLTDSAKRSTWLAAGEMELRPGGRVEHIFRNSKLTGHDDPPPAKYAGQTEESRMHGRIIACDAPRLLAYSWGENTGEHADALSEVRFELSPAGKDVRLVLTHSRLANRAGMVGVSGGWHSHLAVLADRLADRAPGSFWSTFSRLESEYETRIPLSQQGAPADSATGPGAR